MGMESALNRRKADDSYCGFDRGGRVLSNPPLWWVFLFVWKASFRALQPLQSRSPRPPQRTATVGGGRRAPSLTETLLGEWLMDIATRRESGSESFVRSVGGLAVVVLTTFGLMEASSTFVVATATIVWGVGLLLCGAAVLSQMNVPPARYSPPKPTSRVFLPDGRPSFSLVSSALCLGFWRGSASHRRSSSVPRRSRTAALCDQQ